MPKTPMVDADMAPELMLRFWDKWGTYLPVAVARTQAQRARDMVGRRRFKRMPSGEWHVADDTGRGVYRVDLAEMRCTCPSFTTRREQVCKHLVACQWVEDML